MLKTYLSHAMTIFITKKCFCLRHTLSLCYEGKKDLMKDLVLINENYIFLLYCSDCNLEVSLFVQRSILTFR